MARLGDIVKQIRGVSYTPDDLHTSLNKESVILFRANNIRDGEINYDDVVYVDRKKVAKEQYLKKGDIIICASSGSKELVGKAAYIKSDLDVTFGAFCKVVRPNDLEQTEYISHFFQSPAYRRKISDSSTGVNINNIRNEHIDNLEIAVPSIGEQKNISCLLNQVFSLISLRKKQLQKLDDLVKARFVEMFGDPVSNPKGWKKRKLSDLADIRIGPFGSLLHKEDYVTGGHALINPSHIINGNIAIDAELTVSDDKYAELSPYHLLIGDVVMGRRGEMGRCAVVCDSGLLCGTGSLLIRTNGELSADFIQKIISFPSFKRTIEDMAVGQTMPNLNVPIVSEFRIIAPPKDVQDQYYAFVSQADRSKLSIQQGLEKLETLKKSLMQQYFG